MVAPELRKVARETAGRLVVAKVNTEDVPTLGYRNHVSAIPTMTLFQNGIEVARQAGAMPASQIRQFIEQHTQIKNRENNGHVLTAVFGAIAES